MVDRIVTAGSTDDLVTAYLESSQGYDELADGAGGIRPHWLELADSYRRLGGSELLRRRDEIRLQLEQEGVTYNVGGDSSRPHRPWALDPAPLLLPVDEWLTIERGIQQRAELLDLVLRDLYGERRLLRSGLLPPAMILPDPQFSRACDGIRLPSEKQLVIAGVDLYRNGDGRWHTLGHRTQAPSGVAYALENRRVLSRVFPRLFPTAGVRQLGPFVRAFRAAVRSTAPLEVEDPSIVVLSPGSFSETAFEHASIAARLGYPLVEGSDLRVRQGKVWLKTVSDLVPVHVILRRVDALFCDPLELRTGSTLGVPGLVDACRTGSVSVVNTLGSGVLENAGLATLLPRLCQQLLGEDVAIDPVPSWWCGDPAGLSHVVANLGRFVVRPLSRATLEHSFDTSRATRAELEDLRRRIEARPDRWVGQERIEGATAPVLVETGFEPRATVLRGFAVADGGTYLVMAGGLGRTAIDPGASIANRVGAIAKDTWVLGSELDSDDGSWLTVADDAVPLVTGETSARAAENLFWLGRYAERAEATVRLLRTIYRRADEFQDAPAGPGPESLFALLEAMTRITGTYPGFVGDDAADRFDDPTGELLAVVIDGQRPGTVAHAIRGMFDAIDVVRDQLSVDTWLVVGSLQRQIDGLDPGTPDGGESVVSLLDELLHGLLSLSGLATESMVRDHGWHFMDAGRRLERALHVGALVGNTLAVVRPPAVESLLLESVLTAHESIITFRRRYRSEVRLSSAIDLLFGDTGNPRSLRFQVDRLRDDLAVLHAHQPSGSTPSAAPLVLDVARLLQEHDSVSIAEPGDAGHRIELDRLVTTVRTELSAAADAIAADYFTRQLPQRSIVTPIESPRGSR